MPRLTIAIATAIGALMALASPATATTITSAAGSTPTLHLASEGPTTFHGIVDITCQGSTINTPITSHGAGVTAAGAVSGWTFSNCGNNHYTVKSAGSLQLHAVSPTGNATVTSTGADISVSITSLGITCVLTTSNTHIGTLTGSTSSNATLHIESASIPRTGGSVFCGSHVEWTGSFSVASPVGLEIH